MSSLRKRVTLRVFEGGDDSPSGPQLTPQMTLSELFEAYHLPEHLADDSAGTIKEYRTTLKYWEAATDRAWLQDVNDFVVGKFRRYLRALKHRGEPLATATIRKHLTNVQFLLDRAGPKLKRDVPTAKLITEVLAIPKPALDEDQVNDCFSVAEIATYLAGCQFVAVPDVIQGITLCGFWRCAGLLAYNTALRLKTLLSLRWDWLDRDDFGLWFDIPAWAMKRRRKFRCYVNPFAERVLSRLRQCGSETVLPWQRSESWFHKCRRKAMAATALPENRQLGFHAFRKACSTELAQINTFAAAMQLGHKTRDVTLNNYTHRRLLVDAHTRLPQPPWDGDLDGRQGLLFA